MNYCKERVDNIVNNLKLPEEFGVDVNEGSEYYAEVLEEDLEDIDKTATVDSGITKAVIIFPEEDVVLKIPYNGYWEMAEEEYDYDDISWRPFLNGGGSDNDDYCQYELDIYDLAKEYDLEDFFLKTEYYGYVDGHPLYIQEKGETMLHFDDSQRIPSEEAQKTVKTNRNINSIDRYWLAFAVDWYGEEKVEKFCSFVKRHKIEQDLHWHNIGFAIDERPVLIDWAGFRD
jgi:hypothetical protein